MTGITLSPTIQAGKLPVPGAGKAIVCVLIAGAVACGLAFAVQGRSAVSRKWTLLGAGLGGAAFGAGIYKLWRTEAQWRTAMGYARDCRQRLRRVEFLLEPAPGNRVHDHRLKRPEAVGVLLASPFIMTTKVVSDVVALLGSVVGVKDEFSRDLNRLARDVVYVVAYPLGLLVTIPFPRVGQSFVAKVVQWAHQCEKPADVEWGIPTPDHRERCGEFRFGLAQFTRLPQCFQPHDDLAHPVDRKGRHKDMCRILADRISDHLTQRALTEEIVRVAGHNVGIEAGQLLTTLAASHQGAVSKQVAIATFWGMLDERAKQQVQLNDLARHFVCPHATVVVERAAAASGVSPLPQAATAAESQTATAAQSQQ